MIGLYGRDGSKITVDQWIALVGAEDTARVAVDLVGEVEVSTIWIGIDATDRPRPLIFETMIFGGLHHEHSWRWATEEEALAGHAGIVERLRQELA